jgi:predicted Zn-dependent peptidase
MNITKNTLDNGLSSVVIPQQDTPTVTVMVMVGAGSRYETRDENGISHFLEHMFFKGTENRPESHIVSTELDSLGAESNAFTGYEYTAYYGKAQADKADDILEILADIYKNPLLPKEEIKKEAGVITEEIRMYKDLPMRVVHDNFQKHMFGDTPLGRTVLGTEENVNSFQRSDFLDYKNKYYNTNNTAVIISGGVDPSDVLTKIKQHFSRIESSEASQPETAQPDPDSHVQFQCKDTDQAHLIIGSPAASRHSEKLPAVEILSTIVGCGMSSRLFKQLRNEMGVCYYVRSSADYFTDTGLFKVSTGVDTDRVTEVVDVITDTIQNIANNGVNKKELAKAREYGAGNYLRSNETTDQIASNIAKQTVLDDKLEMPTERTEKLRSVSASDVQEMAQKVRSNGLFASVLGPKCDQNSIENILGNTRQ